MKKASIFPLIYTIFPILVYFILFVQWPPPNHTISQHDNTNLSGQELALRYCQMCHKFPDPSLLDKNSWVKTVLPNMGMRLGIKTKGLNPLKEMDSIDRSIAENLNIFPDSPLLSKIEWAKIVAYYKQNAPEKLPPQEKTTKIEKGIFPFESQFISLGETKLPQVTVLKFNQKTSELYIGDYLNLYALKNTGEFISNWKLKSPISHLEFEENGPPLVLTIGKLKPSDQKLGALYHLNTGINSPDSIIRLSHLQRPVNFATGDLNMDNERDVVICNFGNFGGKLSWFESFDQSKEHIISNLPGARSVDIKDLNGDHKPDIIAVMAQAYEQIVIYYNEGNGEFKEDIILQFSPVHGIGHFELADFNNDGYDDLLVTNGDNWDHSIIDKPYHGLRIYMNDGKNNFKEAYFYPMYDCSKAMARDFDNDGDLDIVASSLYTNYTDLKDLKKSFVYLSNKGNLNFTASFLPKTTHGKWLSMEVGDFNQDNLLDVMLGSFLLNPFEMGKIFANTGMTTIPQVLLLTQLTD